MMNINIFIHTQIMIATTTTTTTRQCPYFDRQTRNRLGFFYLFLFVQFSSSFHRRFLSHSLFFNLIISVTFVVAFFSVFISLWIRERVKYSLTQCSVCCYSIVLKELWHDDDNRNSNNIRIDEETASTNEGKGIISKSNGQNMNSVIHTHTYKHR